MVYRVDIKRSERRPFYSKGAEKYLGNNPADSLYDVPILIVDNEETKNLEDYLNEFVVFWENYRVYLEYEVNLGRHQIKTFSERYRFTGISCLIISRPHRDSNPYLGPFYRCLYLLM